MTIVNSAPAEGSLPIAQQCHSYGCPFYLSGQRGGHDPTGCYHHQALPIIDSLLDEIFNPSLERYIFPGTLKKAQLIPFTKKSSSFLPTDFRAVALYSAFASRSWKNSSTNSCQSTSSKMVYSTSSRLALENII